jgi:hypothetical protein
MFASALLFVRGPFVRFIAGVPRPLWCALAAGVALLLLWRWHEAQVDTAWRAGAQAQVATDRAAYARASAAAEAAQKALAARLATRQSAISKGTDDALRRRTDDLARRYDDLRLRWAAHNASESATGNDQPAALSGAATGAYAAACAAAGWVSFDTAAAAAQAADRAIAKDDAWIAWAMAQADAWPKQ